MSKCFLIILVCLMAVACEEQPQDLEVRTEIYDLSFSLPEDWQRNRDLNVAGGFGYASPDWDGQTYLRFHQGTTFTILGDWEPVTDAANLLEAHFANDISNTSSIDILGFEGTYATARASDQGQGMGAAHVTFEQDGEIRQLGFVSTIADEWEEFEPTFLEIIRSLRFVEDE